MQFIKKHENATPDIVNQLWLNGYLNTNQRDDALGELIAPKPFKLWLEKVFLSVGVLFIIASILLFFAYNWTHIHPFAKMGSILGIIFILGIVNFAFLQKNKLFIANLLLTANAFMFGIFMAVFGQIYQTGADAYTLFLTWGILVLPLAIYANFLPLWCLWLLVSNTALYLWLDLPISDSFMANILHKSTILAMFNLTVYGVYEIARRSLLLAWQNNIWVKSLLAVLIFVPLSLHILGNIIDFGYNSTALELGVSCVVFISLYLYVKFIIKSIGEYNIAYISLLSMLIALIIRVIYEIVGGLGDGTIFSFLNLILIGLFLKFAYQYYVSTTQKMRG